MAKPEMTTDRIDALITLAAKNNITAGMSFDHAVFTANLAVTAVLGVTMITGENSPEELIKVIPPGLLLATAD